MFISKPLVPLIRTRYINNLKTKKMKNYLIKFDCFSITIRATTEFNARCWAYDQAQIDNIPYPENGVGVTVVEVI